MWERHAICWPRSLFIRRLREVQELVVPAPDRASLAIGQESQRLARMSRGNPARRAIDYGHSCESLPQVQERQIPLETSLQPSPGSSTQA